MTLKENETTVKGSYNPLGTSPIVSEEMYSLEVRLPNIDPPKNHVGPLIYQDDVVGKIVVWPLPRPTQEDVDKLNYAVNHFSQFVHRRNEYQQLIQTSRFIQYMLIPYLLGMSVGLEPLSDSLKDVIKTKKDFFTFLAQHGAKYKHCLAGAFGAPSLEIYKSLIELYGVEATIPEKDTLNLTIFPLTCHYDNTAFDKIKALLLGGSDINARVDDEYQNTILHYLIALEHHESITIKFIDFIETKMPPAKHYIKAAWDLDYTLQDKYGKTPLLLAVGLNETAVVEKLLKDVFEKNKKNVGLDTPDIEGRTPCMIAAALGHIDILKQLIKAGANCYLRDKEGRDLLSYASLSAIELKDILRFFSIHPDRVSCVTHSYLYSSTAHAFPVVLVEKHNQNKHLVMLSNVEPYYSQLKIALKIAAKNSTKDLNYEYLKQQTTSFMNKNAESIVEFKLRNQCTTRHFIQELLFRFACAFGDVESMKSIGAKKDFNFASCDHLNRTAMHYAVMTKKIVQNLLSSTNYPGRAEECLKRHPEVLEYLLSKNIDLLEIKNSNDNTPLSLIQRDVSSDDQDTREQAQNMLNLLREKNLLPCEQTFKM